MYPPSPNFYDPVLALTWAAACTSRVGLGTSVLVLPMRHPLPLAKELATLQNLSGGRFILGAGVGWMEAEFAALGVPFNERGRRMDEGIAMMRAVWNDDPVSFEPRWIPAVIDNMRMMPKPEQPIPVWIGGTSDGRAAARGAAGRLARLTRHARAGRAPGRAAACRAARAGIHDLRCVPPGTARTRPRSRNGCKVSPRSGSVMSWSSPSTAISAIGSNRSSASPRPARSSSHEARNDSAFLRRWRRYRHGPGVGGREARL